MKIKLTPELAYIIGFWRKRRTQEGLGIYGSDNLQEIFSKEILEKELTKPDKLLTGHNIIYFYHTAYRKFFQESEREQLDRFRYLNEYSANYIAGWFDAAGEINENGMVSLSKANRQDEVLLLRLGFPLRRQKDRLIIEKPKAFLAFVKNYVKRHSGHNAFDHITKKRRNQKPTASKSELKTDDNSG